jgi:hypothetical protein
VSNLIEELGSQHGSADAMKYVKLAHKLVCRAIPQLAPMAETAAHPIVEAPESRSVMLMERAATALAEAKTIDEVRQIRDQAEAARVYAKKRDLGEQLVADASAIKLRAERRLGELLQAMPLHKGGRPTQNHSHDESGFEAPKLADLGLDHNESYRCQRIADVPEDRFERYVGESLSKDEPPTTAGLLRHINGPHVARNSGGTEWYTPDEYLDAARRVMGGIDVDPATSIVAQARVQAQQFFTVEDDGLAHDWHGRVWLNPPYATDLIGKFVGKLVGEYEIGRVQEAIALTNNATDTNWFQVAAPLATAICLLRGRVKFLDPTGNPNSSPLQGQCFLYFGPNVDRFYEAFSPLGYCCCGLDGVVERHAQHLVETRGAA